MAGEPTSDENFAAAFKQITEAESNDGKPAAPIASVQSADQLPAEGQAEATREQALDAEAAEAPPASKAPKVAAATKAPVQDAAEGQDEGLPDPAEEEARLVAEAAAAAKKPVPKSAPAAGEITDDDLMRRLAGLVRNAKPAEEPKPGDQGTQQPEAPFTSEEVEFLTNYEKDFPDVSKAEELKRRAEYQTVVSYVFQEIAKELTPIVAQVRTLLERTHLGDLQTAVPDYDTLRDQVVAWAGQQPAYIQPAYNHVIQHGTVDEIADLINRFRQETGIELASARSAATADTELPVAARKAVAALAPVGSKRTATVSTPSLEDYDGAFAEAARTLGA